MKLLRDWLVCSDPLEPADLIFVLAGRRSRKTYGVDLWHDGWAHGILLSTFRVVPLDLSGFAELRLPAWPRLLELQSGISSEGGLFFLHYDGDCWHAERLAVRPLGTLNEVAHFADWLRRHPKVRSVLVVSTGSHLRRVRMCCRALLPRSVRFLFAAGSPDNDRLIAEWAKLFLYWIVLAILPKRVRETKTAP